MRYLIFGDLNGFLIRAEITAFSSITKKSGIKSNIKPPPPPAVVVLDAHTFDDVVLVSGFAPLHMVPFLTWILNRTKIMIQLSRLLRLGAATARI